MRTGIACGALLVSAVALSGCVMPKTGDVQAAIVNDHIASAPFVDNSVAPIKHGESRASGIICFASGDASIGTAMRNGGIKKVHHVDYNVKNILFIYSETVTTVYGE